jgi:hypothetical protein
VNDLRLARRVLAKDRSWSLLAVLVFALGIGVLTCWRPARGEE